MGVGELGGEERGEGDFVCGGWATRLSGPCKWVLELKGVGV